MPAKREGNSHVCNLRSLTFELRRDRRQGARPDGWMINRAGRRAWWLAVGPRLERGVRRHLGHAPAYVLGLAKFRREDTSATRKQG
jgi:hypothetical protein